MREHINPTHASPQISSDIGDITILSWSISATGSSAALYEGKGSDADGALKELLQSGEEGEYELVFYAKDPYGVNYTFWRSFFHEDRNF